MNMLWKKFRRFKNNIQMEMYLLFHNPCKPQKDDIDIRALCEYAERMNKTKLTRKEVKQFRIGNNKN